MPGPAGPSRPSPGARALFHQRLKHRHLTTQINLSGEKYLWDAFAYATRDGLAYKVRFHEENGQRYARLDFDFQLQAVRDDAASSAAPAREPCSKL